LAGHCGVFRGHYFPLSFVLKRDNGEDGEVEKMKRWRGEER
jgi:hypothetical protein